VTKQSITLILAAIALVLVGAVLGWLSSPGECGRHDLAVENLSVRHIRLTDSQGHTRAELKSEDGATSMTFFDGANRQRLTLALGASGVAIAVNGRDDTNQLLLAVNDALRTSSIFIAATTTAINLVGTREARLKISDSVRTDSNSASLSVAEQVTKLRLASDGAQSQLWAENAPARRGTSQRIRSVELNMRTSTVPDARLRVSSDEKPVFQLSAANARVLPRPH
jgi:hypothetical protein